MKVSLSEKLKDGAWVAWRALALVAALSLSQLILGSWDIVAGFLVTAAGTWALLGWNAARPGRMAAATAVVVLIEVRIIWHLPMSLVLFVPIWAALFSLPAIFREDGIGRRYAPWLPRRVRECGQRLRSLVYPLAGLQRIPEILRIATAAGMGLFAIMPFIHDGIMGGADARWYTAMVADNLVQWRTGFGPVFVGQTYYGAIGTVMPLRVAPYLQHLTLALDFLTGQRLTPYLLLNIAVVVSSVAGCVSAYLCTRTILPKRRLEALLLAAIYSWCPAVIGLAYAGQLYMSVMALPYLPIAFAGVVMIFERDSFTGWAMAAAGSAACWLCHSPIGMWVTFCVALALAARWAFGLGRERRELLRAGGAALLGLGVCGYVFISIFVLAPPKLPPTPVPALLSNLNAMFPAELLPVSPGAGSMSDLQLGWSVMAVLLFAAFAGWRLRAGAIRALLLVALVLTCLSLPVPFISEWLWRAVPQTVLDATKEVPTQRLYPILAACSVTLAASTLALLERRRAQVLMGLSLCVLWGGLQLRPFLYRGALIANSKATSEGLMSPNNLVPAKFSTGFLGMSAFFSHGFVDYELEQRVLDETMKKYIVSNAGSVAPGFDFGPHDARRNLALVLQGTPAANGSRFIEISPKLTLAPRQHYLLAMDFEAESYAGVFQIKGAGLMHEYILPASGQRFAFGSTSVSSSVIPLFNESTAPLDLMLDFVVQDPSADLARYRDFARYELIPYQEKDLPIRLVSYEPFVAEVRSPAPGWYEPFRYFTTGWTATVDGQPTEVRRTENHLIAVPVPAGESEVRLIYRPPTVLLVSYLVTGVTCAGLLVFGVWTALKWLFTGARLNPCPGGNAVQMRIDVL